MVLKRACSAIMKGECVWYLAQEGGWLVGKARILSLLPGIRANTVKWRELSKTLVNLLIIAPDL